MENREDFENMIIRHNKMLMDQQKREQYIANEVAMQPLIVRLQEIIFLLKQLLDEVRDN